METLSSTGLLARTVIVFTSDNGWMSGQHRIASGKRVAYEESIRVPLIVRGPGFPRGVKRTASVSNIDLAPTIVSLAHARAGLRMDGCSLRPLAARAGARWQRQLLFENLTTTGLGSEGDKIAVLPKYAAIRSGQFKWVEYANGERELYDLAADPHELVNRAAEPGLADTRALLSSASRGCARARLRPASSSAERRLGRADRVDDQAPVRGVLPCLGAARVPRRRPARTAGAHLDAPRVARERVAA